MKDRLRFVSRLAILLAAVLMLQPLFAQAPPAGCARLVRGGRRRLRPGDRPEPARRHAAAGDDLRAAQRRRAAYLTTGWQQRVAAVGAGDGISSVRFTAPEPGIYYVFFESSSLHLSFNQSSPLILEAVAAK